MQVRERMSPNPITIPPDTSVPDALRLMRDKRVRRLPVIDKQGKLAGIVSDKDLLLASPSPATTLAVWEIPELLGKLKVSSVMTRPVITVGPDTPLEEAARIMADRRIGGLPVMDGGRLVGIITETDLFKALLALLGGRRGGIRVVVAASGAPGTLAHIAEAIAGAGGDIVGLGVAEPATDGAAEWEILAKVQGVSQQALLDALKPVVTRVIDVREEAAPSD